MKVKITRIDKNLPLPKYETAGAAAFDFIVRETTRIKPKSVGLMPSNLIMQVPAGYMLVVVPRSSTPRKKGLSIPHGIGIIDNDYCGPQDEIMIQVYNFTASAVTIVKGERVAQGVFVRVNKATFKEEKIISQTRGGFGSTG